MKNERIDAKDIIGYHYGDAAAEHRPQVQAVLYRTQQAVSQLSDHMLRDIGLTREDIAVGHFESRVRRETQERGW